MALPNLPSDLVEEILCYVPAHCLKRLKPTCKRWNHLFKDSKFLKKHCAKATKQNLYLTLSSDLRISPVSVNLSGVVPSVEVKRQFNLFDYHNSKYPWPAQFDVCRVFHCEGLLLCTSQNDSRFVVWNPLTGETRWIQPNITGMEEFDRTYVLGYNQDHKYKILSFSNHSNKSEIYEFSSDSWRTIDPISHGYDLNCHYHSLSLKGSTYMFARYETLYLFKFDFSIEKSLVLPLPYVSPTGFEDVSLSVVKEEKLAVLLHTQKSSKNEIWLTNKIVGCRDNVVSWSKFLVFDMSLSPSGIEIDDVTFLVHEEKKMVICSQRCAHHEHHEFFKDIIFIAGEDNEVTLTNVLANVGSNFLYGFSNMFSYVPSLVQIERPGGIKRKRGVTEYYKL